MGVTPKLAIPYAEPGDWLADYPAGVDKPRADLLDSLFGAPDTGWITGSGSSIFVPNATNFTLGSSVIRVRYGLVSIYLSGTMKVASGAPGATGDISNIELGQFIAAYRPAAGGPIQGLMTGPWGRPIVPFLANGSSDTGKVVVGAITGTTALAVGESISVSGTYLL